MSDVNQTNKERLAVMETKIDAVQTDIKEIKESITKWGELDEQRHKELEKYFAAKWTERAVYFILTALVGIALTIIFGA